MSRRIAKLASIYKKAAGVIPSKVLEFIQTSGYKHFFEFKNELGNDISIGVKLERSDSDDYDSVNIVIEGPNSTSENILTYKEAEILSEVLKNFLNDIK